MGMRPFYLPLQIILLFVILSKHQKVGSDTFCLSHPYSQENGDTVHSVHDERSSLWTEKEKGDSVETRLIAYEHAATVGEVAGWTNDLIGKEVPGNPGYILVSVVQFQLIDNQGTYDALILVEVTEREIETQVTLRAADVAVIQELTSSIDETA